jgi:hypothetical protein
MYHVKMMKYLVIFASLLGATGDMILGRQEDMNLVIAMKITNNTLHQLKRNCSAKSNDIICSIDTIEIRKATEQIVHGYIYDINALTTKGTMDIQLWYQTAPQMVSMHKFLLNEKDMFKSVTYFKSHDIIP